MASRNVKGNRWDKGSAVYDRWFGNPWEEKWEEIVPSRQSKGTQSDPWTVEQLKERVQLSRILTLLEKRVYDDPSSPFDGRFDMRTKQYLNPIISEMNHGGRTSYKNGTIELNKSLDLDGATVMYAYELQNASNYKKSGAINSAATIEEYLNVIFDVETDAELTAVEFYMESGLVKPSMDARIRNKLVKLISEFRIDYNIKPHQLMADIRADPSKFDMKGNKRILKLRLLANPRYRSSTMVEDYIDQWEENH
jgi:hypothetical protein